MSEFVKKKATKGKGPAAESVEGIAEIGFDLGTQTGAPKSATKYPLIDGAEKLADKVIELQEKFDAVADPLKATKLELIELGFPQFFRLNRGRVEAPSSMIAHGTRGGVRVTFKDKYTAGDKLAIYTLLGTEDAAKWFRQYWEVKIKSDDIPPAVAPAFVADLKALMAKHGISSALNVKAQILPNKQFTDQRHITFDVETNLKINEIVPQQAAVSTKGVK